MISLVGSAVVVASEEAFPPVMPPSDRYSEIWKRSPFVVETKVIEQSDGLARRYTLTGIAKLDEEPVAFLLDTQSLLRFAVSRSRPRDGIELVSVVPASDLKESFATIRRGDEEAVLKYDPTSFRLSATDGSVPPQTNAPNNPNQAGSPQVPVAPVRASRPGAPVGVTQAAPAIPDAQNPSPAQPVAQPTAPEPASTTRRRLIKTAE